MVEQDKKTLEDKGKTILVVEDNEMNVTMLCRRLTRKGYTVVSASDGQQGWEAYKRVKPDLILTDINMPVADGRDLLRWVKEKDLSTPVIFVTAHALTYDAVEALKLGADDYIVKPLYLPDLLKAIERCLSRSPAELEVDRLKRYTSLLEQENKKLKEQLDQFSKSQEDKRASQAINSYKAICGVVAHNLKGEFLHIGNSNKTIREQAEDSPDIQDECELIERSVEYSQLLLRRLLDFIELGRPKVESVSVWELLRRTELLARPRLPSSIQLEITTDPNVKEQIVSADVEQLMGVLLELIHNAANVLRESGGTIELKTEDSNGELAISVKDNGAGIPEELRDKLFKEQVSSKRGLGLGLFLSNKEVAALGGKLSLLASSQKGTTFMILLPMAGDRKAS